MSALSREVERSCCERQREREKKRTTVFGLPVSSSSPSSISLSGHALPPFLFTAFSPVPSSRVPQKITSTCNSAATCNASLARYRKRYSRPLVTTALKRHSIFRQCVSSVLYAPRRLNPRGGSCLSYSSSPPLPRAISRRVRRRNERARA